eukprot:TRINITY_DN3581_c0_g1_i4.p5 TRINITY_DN3581_c0_g1~~TRINITY_DN3581_c0_g1_i4.p5  ORF type:complete len:198 (+),score=16.93 TRINITY_DN3581_c0_g1_i4:59-652(+)
MQVMSQGKTVQPQLLLNRSLYVRSVPKQTRIKHTKTINLNTLCQQQETESITTGKADDGIVVEPYPETPTPSTSPVPTSTSKPISKSSSSKPFENILRFEVMEDAKDEFEYVWKQREQAMSSMSGFVSLNIEQNGKVYVVRNQWASVEEWEAWSLSIECRRTHLPLGVYQFVPKKGEGFPEDFVPFKDMNQAVNAKY